MTTDKKTRNLIKPAFDKQQAEIEAVAEAERKIEQEKEDFFEKGVVDVKSHIEQANLLLKDGHAFYAMKHFKMANHYFPDVENWASAYKNTLAESRTVFSATVEGWTDPSNYTPNQPIPCRVRLNKTHIEMWYEASEGFFVDTRFTKHVVRHYPYLHVIKPKPIDDQPIPYEVMVRVLGCGVKPEARLVSESIDS